MPWPISSIDSWQPCSTIRRATSGTGVPEPCQASSSSQYPPCAAAIFISPSCQYGSESIRVPSISQNTALTIRFDSVMMFLPYDRRTRSTGFAYGAVHRDFLCHFSRAARRQICKQMQRLQMLQQNNKRNNKQGSSTTANKKRPDVLSSERFPHQRNNPRLRNHPLHTLQATPIAATHDIRKISLLSEDSKSTLPDSPCFPQRIPRTFPHLLPSSGQCNVPHACSR